MKLKFTKMHGAGNDFVVLDGIRQTFTLTRAQIARLADRHVGIGADQVLLIESPQRVAADFKYRIFNQDGREVEQCGNGARCVARFVYASGLSAKRHLCLEVQQNVLTLALHENGDVTVNMGRPIWSPAQIPFDTVGLDSHIEGIDTVWPLEINGRLLGLSVVSMGNPHAVQVVDEIEGEGARVVADGAQIVAHRRFSAQVNAGFMQIISPHALRLRVYERGVGETLACGTGACAAAVTAIRRRRVSTPVSVSMPGGALIIDWEENGEVHMTGPATTVFQGEIEI
jgi:diaminopimelate epimerase